jgi:hypothetical protein
MAVLELDEARKGCTGSGLDRTMAMTIHVYKDLHLKLKSSVSIS